MQCIKQHIQYRIWYNIYNPTNIGALNKERLVDEMKSLLNSVLETAELFRNCDGYLQSVILREECAELIVALSHFERTRKGLLMKY